MRSVEFNSSNSAFRIPHSNWWA